jgi:glycerol uptake facilitator protein
MNRYVAEFLGTMILVLLGNGVVSNVLLARTKGHGAGWITIAFGWGMAVFVAVFCTDPFSGAHLNPAVTIALAAAGKWGKGHFGSWLAVGPYIACQMAGAFVGACLVYFFHKPYFDATEDRDAKLACFCTAPNIRSMSNALFCEIVGTFVLVFPIFVIGVTGPRISPAAAATPSLATTVPTGDPFSLGLGAIGALPVGLLVLAIGLSLGGTTGYAINPARDLGPRIAHFLLPIKDKRDPDWNYAWVPVVGPILGGLLATLVAILIKLGPVR